MKYIKYKKKAKNEFYDLEIVSVDNKNAIETPFLAVSSPQKGMRGIPIGFWEKSNFFGSIGSLKGAKIAIFVQGGH